MLKNKDILLIVLGAYAAFDVAMYATMMNKYPVQTKALTAQMQTNDYMLPVVAGVGVAVLAWYFLDGSKMVKKMLK